jgi:hypothetical protein
MAHPSGRFLLGVGVTAVVAAVLVLGLLAVGSPAEQRRRRIDRERVDDLMCLADAIDHYWTREGKLPQDLDALADERGRGPSRKDPQSGTPYVYRTAGAASYELCATFSARAADPEVEYVRQSRLPFWDHAAGEVCFDLEAETVDH